MTEPTYRTGKICYIELPSTNIALSADFYHRVFGWQIRRRGDGSTAFDDSVGEVSGSWVLGRRPQPEGSLIVHIMVADAKTAREAVVAAGGAIVRDIDPASREIYFLFRDPCGNVMGVYQQPGLAEVEKGARDSRGRGGECAG